MASPSSHGAQPPLESPASSSPAAAAPGAEDNDNDNGDNGANIPSTSPSPDLPLTMTASLVLTSLPRDATTALAETNEALFPADQKIVVRFKPVGGSAPPLPAKRELSRVSAGQKFEVVVGYLHRVLRVGAGDGGQNGGGSVFCYVNATFAPALDEVVGNLWRVGFLSPFSFAPVRFVCCVCLDDVANK